jgi:hypothetical protein
MEQGKLFIGVLVLLVCCFVSSGGAMLFTTGDTGSTGPTGASGSKRQVGPSPINCEGSWSEWSECDKSCGGGSQTRTWTTTAEAQYGGSCPSPTTETQSCNTDECPVELRDGEAYEYISTNNYTCESGKDIGCAKEDGGIMTATGVYPSCGSDTSHVYCMNPKTITNAQYNDNELTTASHRFSATGKRCYNAAMPSYCQDDQSIAASGYGNTRKIQTNAYDRQCVDNSILYCFYPGDREWLEDGSAFAYDSNKNYSCKTGKDVGCAAEGNGIMSATGVYSDSTKCGSGTTHVYCMKPKTVTDAQYNDNELTTASHRLSATGKRCYDAAMPSYCQDDQSIAASGQGNTRKISTNVNSRQCVDNSIMYCYYPGGKEWIEDGTAYNYDSSKNYACKTGKTVGCVAKNGDDPMWWKGEANGQGKCPSGTDYAFCLGPQQTTDNRDCYCQNDKSITSSTSSGGDDLSGQKRKIHTNTQERACVKNSGIYC